MDRDAHACFFKKLEHHKYAKKMTFSKGKPLWVRPPADKLEAFRTMKAIENEGFPLFKNTMSKGNLFIDISVDFPDSLDAKAQKELRKIFKVRGLTQKPEDNKKIDDVCILTDLDPLQSEKKHARSYEDADDNTDDQGGHGTEGVQCAQQ